MGDVEVRRFAIKYDPPTLVVEYRRHSKLYIKRIRIIRKATTQSVDALCTKIMNKYPALLGPDKVCSSQLTDLLTLLTSSSATQDERDLNKLDDDELEREKAKMDVVFESHRLRPGDPNFVYNKEVEFAPAEEAADWDDEEDDEDEDRF